MSITVRVLQANHGDCILVTHEGSDSAFNLLIDGGNSSTFRFGPRERHAGALCRVLDELKQKGQGIDLAVLTHIDDDHINGLKKAFARPGYLADMVRLIWFNSSKLITDHFKVSEIPVNNIYLPDASAVTTIQQGKDLEALLMEVGCQRAPIIIAGQRHCIGPFRFAILSPDKHNLEELIHEWPAEGESGETSAVQTDYSLSLKEIWEQDQFKSDPSIYNGSSIAFILEADGSAMLFLGDAHDEVVTRNLRLLGYKENKKLNVELVKISHHGSQFNTSAELLSLITAQNFVISTNGRRHGLPNKRTIARILAASEGKILFNYRDVITPMLLDHEVEQYSSRLEVLDNELRF